jgi:hypothetical protein
MSRLIEGEDFYYNEDGYMVLTEKFHLAKGFCCGNGCKHCPYKAPSGLPCGEGQKTDESG